MSMSLLSARPAFALLTLLAGGRMHAQEPPRRATSTEAATRQPPARVCASVASVVSLRVVDARGAAVTGATIAVTRAQTGKALTAAAAEMGKGSGEYALLEDDALQWLAPAGETIRVAVSKGTRSVRADLTIGRDPSGCRIARLSGPHTVTLP